MNPINITAAAVSLFVSTSNLFAQSPGFLTNGLVAYYQFNGNADDSSGNGNNGTPNGIAYVSDRLGFGNSAASFAGTSSYVVVNTTNFNLTTYTVSLWIKPTVGLGIQGPRLFSTGGYEITCDAAANNLALSPRFVEFYARSAIFQAGIWMHVVATFKTNRAEIYLNGALSGSTDNAPMPDFSNGWQPTIGVNSGSYANDNYGGLIDDLRIYNRALSAQEVAALYDTEAPIVGIMLLPTVTVRGVPGKTYDIQYVEEASATNWATWLSNITFPTNGIYIFPDTNTLNQPKRFYRAFVQ